MRTLAIRGLPKSDRRAYFSRKRAQRNELLSRYHVFHCLNWDHKSTTGPYLWLLSSEIIFYELVFNFHFLFFIRNPRRSVPRLCFSFYFAFQVCILGKLLIKHQLIEKEQQRQSHKTRCCGMCALVDTIKNFFTIRMNHLIAAAHAPRSPVARSKLEFEEGQNYGKMKMESCGA